MAKKVSPTNTKAQILDAYNELLKELEARVNDNPKEQKERLEKKEIVKNAVANTEKNISKNISTLKANLLESLSDIEKDLTNEYKRLSDIRQAIEIEKKNLEDLYEITASTDTLAAILLAQKEKKQEFEEEMALRKEEMEREFL